MPSAETDVGCALCPKGDNSTANVSTAELLEQLNIESLPTFLPAMAYLSLVALSGTVGNILVLLVYLRSFRPSTTRFLILSLAAVDLWACAVAIPGEVARLRLQHSFHDQTLCRLVRVTGALASLMSGLLVLITAADRYWRICKPTRNHVTSTQAYVIALGACVVSLAVGALYYNVSGVKHVPTRWPGVQGSVCSPAGDQAKGSPLALVFYCVFFAMVVVSIGSVAALYLGIFLRLRKQRQYRHARRHTTADTTVAASQVDRDYGTTLERRRDGKKQLRDFSTDPSASSGADRARAAKARPTPLKTLPASGLDKMAASGARKLGKSDQTVLRDAGGTGGRDASGTGGCDAGGSGGCATGGTVGQDASGTGQRDMNDERCNNGKVVHATTSTEGLNANGNCRRDTNSTEGPYKNASSACDNNVTNEQNSNLTDRRDTCDTGGRHTNDNSVDAASGQRGEEKNTPGVGVGDQGACNKEVYVLRASRTAVPESRRASTLPDQLRRKKAPRLLSYTSFRESTSCLEKQFSYDRLNKLEDSAAASGEYQKRSTQERETKSGDSKVRRTVSLNPPKKSAQRNENIADAVPTDKPSIEDLPGNQSAPPSFKVSDTSKPQSPPSCPKDATPSPPYPQAQTSTPDGEDPASTSNTEPRVPDTPGVSSETTETASEPHDASQTSSTCKSCFPCFRDEGAAEGTKGTEESVKDGGRRGRGERDPRQRLYKSRTTLILTVIGAVYVLSYLPFLALGLMWVGRGSSLQGLSLLEQQTFHVLYRSFYIGAAANPVLYSFLNAKFRAECAKLLRRLACLCRP